MYLLCLLSSVSRGSDDAQQCDSIFTVRAAHASVSGYFTFCLFTENRAKVLYTYEVILSTYRIMIHHAINILLFNFSKRIEITERKMLPKYVEKVIFLLRWIHYTELTWRLFPKRLVQVVPKLG